jgi:hypothetical protein
MIVIVLVIPADGWIPVHNKRHNQTNTTRSLPSRPMRDQSVTSLLELSVDSCNNLTIFSLADMLRVYIIHYNGMRVLNHLAAKLAVSRTCTTVYSAGECEQQQQAYRLDLIDWNIVYCTQ